MPPPQRGGRSRYRLALLVLTGITLLSLDLRGFGPLESAQRGVRNVVHPISSVVGTVLAPVGDVWNSIFSYGDLEAENTQLRAEIDEMRGSSIEAEAGKTAFDRLREAVGISFGSEIPTVAATVLRGEVDNFSTDVVTIDRGSSSGLKPDMAVVTGAGFVGRLVEVDRSTSVVQLATDPDLSIGVRMASTDQVGLGHGVPGSSNLFVIDQGPGWPEGGDESLLPEIGSAVVTAVDSRYPSEIPIGRIVDVSTPDGLAMVVMVELSTDVTDIGFVSVMLAIEPDEVPLLPLVPEANVPADLDQSSVDDDHNTDP